MLCQLGRAEDWRQDAKLLRQFQTEPPVTLIVHFEELFQPREVGVALFLAQQLQEVCQMLQDPNPHFVQVFDESIEYGHKVGGGNVFSKDDTQLMDGAGEGAADLPLHVVCQALVGLLEERPVGAAEGESHRWQGEGAVPGDVVIHGLGPAGVDHGDVVVYEELRHDGLVGLWGPPG